MKYVFINIINKLCVFKNENFLYLLSFEELKGKKIHTCSSAIQYTVESVPNTEESESFTDRR